MIDPWQTFAAGHALRPDPRDHRVWCGTPAGVPTRLELVPTGPDARAFRVAMTVGHPGLVVVALAHALSDDGRRLTGDVAFDTAVWLASPDPTIHGFFDAPMRARVASLVARGVHLDGEALRLEPWAALPDHAVAATLAQMLAWARALVQSTEASRIAALGALAQRDPVATVRARIAALGDASDAIRHALRAAAAAQVDDPAWLVRLGEDRATWRGAFDKVLDWLARADVERAPWLGALHQLVRRRGAMRVEDVRAVIARVASDGAHGLPILAALMEDADPAFLEPALGALLGLDVRPEVALAALAPAVRARCVALAPALARELGRREAGPLLLALRDASPSPGLEAQRAYLQAFAALGLPRPVEDALASDDPHLVEEAIRGLEGCGDRASLQRLEPLTQGLLRDRDIKVAARRAVAAIRARIGLEPGGLSLAEGDRGGALTLDDER